MEPRMKGKVALVTGSTSGIGESIARRLAAEGAAVVVSGRRHELGEQVVQAIRAAGGQAVFTEVDMAGESAHADLVQAALEHFGRLDVLVNNAAIFPSIPLEELTVAQWDEVFAVNVRGPFLCCRAAIAPMRAQGGGAIINIGSTLAYRASAERLAYACSKGALLTMTKTLAQELAPEQIRVNWVTVGWVATPGEVKLRNQTHGDGATWLAEQSARMPMGRLETPEDIAGGVAFLASDDASHVTGCELNISGGLWM